MQENSTQPNTPKNSIFIPVTVVSLIAIATIAIYSQRSNNPEKIESITSTPTAIATTTPTSTSTAMASENYKDGDYEVEGSYLTPGGPRTIKVALSINNGLISDSTFEGLATDPASKRFQKEFGDNYKTMIMGKKINEVELTKVSGSSLTPKGFMDALNKIKMEAQSS